MSTRKPRSLATLYGWGFECHLFPCKLDL